MKKHITKIVGAAGVLAVIMGMLQRKKQAASIAIIGGADGPTSIFLAGKVGKDTSLIWFAVGGICVIVALVEIIRKKR